MRGSSQGGRFDIRYEVDAMYEGMSDDLYDPVGTTFKWFVYDAASTSVDPIYDVGDPGHGGRHWTGPYRVPVLGARFIQGEASQDKRGMYQSDTLHAVINVSQLQGVLPTLLDDPDLHDKDRFLWRSELWQPIRLWPRGRVSSFTTVVSLDAIQVKDDQLVNDTYFSQFAEP